MTLAARASAGMTMPAMRGLSCTQHWMARAPPPFPSRNESPRFFLRTKVAAMVNEEVNEGCAS